MPGGRDAEGETGEQQEEAGGEAPLELPDVVQPAGAIGRRQQRVQGVAVEHEDHRERAGQVDEDDTRGLRASRPPGGPDDAVRRRSGCAAAGVGVRRGGRHLGKW